MNLVLFGPPGSGKGTQSQFLVKKFDMFYVSTGDIARREIEQKTDLGLQLKDIIARGELFSDEILGTIVKKVVEQSGTKSLLCDGFPRTQAQAQALTSIFEKNNKNLDLIIEIDVSEDELVNRVLNRYTCAGCSAVYNASLKPLNDGTVCETCGSKKFNKRADDTEQTIGKRYAIYRKHVLEIMDYYRGIRVNIVKIDGTRSIKEVQETIMNEITKITGRA